ncbi:MAG: hydroxymethylbilane synthase [Verrucomicrobiota bacterium]|nr:hydroxymethylbilane synthase [Verrucomicrobiota bacterium]
MVPSINPIILATRKSPLALAQAVLTQSYFATCLPGIACELLKIVTTGDQRQQWSLTEQGGKGLFTKELETALLEGRAHVAVHSSKDLPTELGPGLALAGFLPRAAVNDVLVYREGIPAEAIKTIATSSPRRKMQLARRFPQAQWSEIRGNVDTRLRKIAEGQADATLLAAAGLERLGIHAWPGVIFEPLKLEESVPAPGQGAVALECRTEDAAWLAALLDAATGLAVHTERALLDLLGGGCHSAVAAYNLGNRLLVFHEKTGFNEYTLAGSTVEARMPQLRQIAVDVTRQH